MRVVALRTALLVCACGLFAAGCGKNETGSCANVSCNGVCCAAGEVCQDGVCAAPSCTPESREAFCARMAQAGKVCGRIGGKDNCDTDRTEECGSSACSAEQVCATASNTCVACVMETRQAFCERQADAGKVCGSITAKDANCTARDHTEDCGTAACAGGTCKADNTCLGCTKETKTAFCTRQAAAGKVCGSITAKDANCTSEDHTEDCGTASCPSNSCKADNTCEACTTEVKDAFCARQAQAGKTCGAITAKDLNCPNSDHAEDCGVDACPSGSCQNDNTCVACTMEEKGAFCARQAQAGKVCGSITARDLNCPNSDHTEECGVESCPSASCEAATNTCTPCTMETNSAFCTRQAQAGLVCGSITAKDAHCVVVDHTEDCGTTACQSYEVCDSANHCACTSEGPSAFCARMASAGKVCGSITGADNCQRSRTEDCGTAACGAQEACNASNNHCECVPESLANFCSAMALVGKVCGPITGTDNCGNASRTENCGIEACVEPTASCDTATNHCVCVPESDEAFCARMAPTGKVCGSVTGTDNCSATRTVDCGVAACTNGQICAASTNSCYIANDDCTAAEALTFAGTPATATVTFDTTRASNTYTGSCAAMTGGDVVYSFSIPTGQTKRVIARVTTADTTYTPAVYIRSANCASAATADELACAAGRAGFEAVATVASLGAGNYHVIIDGAAGSHGAFTLTVTLGALLNDDCTSPAAELPTSTLDADFNGTITVRANTTNATTSTNGTCRALSSTGPNLVYAFDIPTGMTKLVVVTMNFDDNPSAVKFTNVFIRTACASAAPADEVVCAYGTSTPYLTTAAAKNLPAGRYYLWVGAAYSTDKGPFTMNVTFATPPPVPSNDTCGTSGANAQALVLDAAPVAGDTGSAAADYGAAMSSSSGSACYTAFSSTAAVGGDAVYSYTPSADGDFWVELLPSGWTGALWYTNNGVCGDTGANCVGAKKGAAAGAAVDLKIAGVTGTTYHIYVDALSTSAFGPYTIAVKSPPANVTCAGGAVALALNAVPVIGSTGMATADYGGALSSTVGSLCYYDLSSSGSAASGPDMVYSYTPSADGDVYAELVPFGWTGALWYTVDTCGTTGADCVHAKVAASAGATVDLRIPGVAGTTYYIYVDSTSSSTSGGFSIAIRPAPALPNNLCGTTAGAKAIALALDVPVTGTTAIATADYGRQMSSTSGSTCYSALGSSAAAGPELVYSFTPTVDGDVWVDLVPTDWIGVLWYTTNTCGDTGANCVGAKKSAAAGAAVDLKIAAAANTTYFIYVDSTSQSISGSFTLTAKPAPANDVCAGATPLTMGGTPVAGSTGMATADFGGSMASGQLCYIDLSNSAASGPDLVYSYTPTVNGDFFAELVPNNWIGALWYTTGTCGGNGVDCVHARKSATTGATVDLRIPGVANTTYYIYVDSTSATTLGSFTIALKPAPALPNDICGGTTGPKAVALTLDAAAVSGDTTDATADYGQAMSSSVGGTCYTGLSSAAATGPELAYAFTPSVDGDYWLQVVPTGWSAAVWYTAAACGDTGANCVAAKKSASSGAAVDMKLTGVGGTTYFIYVDSTSLTAAGPFTIAMKTFPTNDQCSGAIALAMNGTPLAGNIAPATNDYGGGISSSTGGGICYADVSSYAASGPELVYSYTPSADGDFYVEVVPTGWNAYVWYNVGTCGGNGSDCVHAKRSPSAGNTVDLRIPGVAGTTYYLYVDGASTFGPFTIALKPAPALPNDLCGTAGAKAIALSLDAAPVSGDTSDATADYGRGMTSTVGATCYTALGSSAASGPDLVYSFTPSADGNYWVQLVPDGWIGALWYTTGTCGDNGANCVAAKKGSASGLPVDMKLAGVAGTTYFIYVDSTALTTFGPFTLAVKSFPANDVCGPGVVALSLNGAPVAGSTGIAASDYGSSISSTVGTLCYYDASSSSQAGPELVYSYTPAADGDFYAEMVPNGFIGQLWYTVDACGGNGSDCVHAKRGASSGATVDLRIQGVSGTTYYLYADSNSSSTSGAFTIAVKPAPALPNDVCGAAGVKAVALALDAAPVAGDTSDATADYGRTIVSGNPCYSGLNSTNAGGPELVYRYAPAADGDFWVEMIPTGFTGALWYTTGTCGDTGANCVGAKVGASSGAAVDLAIPGVAGTTYYIYADSTSMTGSGAFTIALKSPPANSTCAGAIPALALGAAPIVADSTFAAPNYGGSMSSSSGATCYGDLASSAASGNDLVYRYTPTSNSEFVIELATQGWAGAVWYTTGTCGDAGANCVHARKSTSSQPALLRVAGVANTTYYIYVDSTSAAAYGIFSLAIKSAQGAPNSTCGANGANAVALTLDGPAVRGTTTDATADYGSTLASACNTSAGGNAVGPELVYKFQPNQSGDFYVEVNPLVPSNLLWTAAAWQPIVWYTVDDCGNGSACVAAKKAVATGSTVGVVITGTAPSTYFFHVDSASITTYGPFTIAVKTPPTNNVCGAAGANATVLTLDGAPTAGNLGAAAADYGSGWSSTVNSACYSDLSSSSASGPDLVYAYTPAAAGDFWIEVVPAGWAATVWYTTGACDAGACTHAKRNSTTSGVVDLKVAAGVASTTYYIYVDQTSTTTAVGAFTIAVKSPPPNDVCGAGVVPLTLSRPVAGSTMMATADVGGTLSSACYSDASSSNAAGADLIYSYTPATSGDFRVELVPTGWSGNTYDMIWYNVGTCGGVGSDCVHAKKSVASYNQKTFLTISGVANTTYYLYADASSTSYSGYFTMEVKPATGAPSNNTCGANGANAIELFLDAPPTAGDATEATADYACSGSSPYVTKTSAGKELVYKYTPLQNGIFYVRMDTDRFDATLWYSLACDATSGSTCAAAVDNTIFSAPETLVIYGVANTTYYLFADDYYGAASSLGGSFTIAVKSISPLPY